MYELPLIKMPAYVIMHLGFGTLGSELSEQYSVWIGITTVAASSLMFI